MNAPFERHLLRALRAPKRIFRRKLQFEPLEQRLLLSADGVSPNAPDLLKTVDSDNLTAALVQESQASPTVIIDALRAQLRAAGWANEPIDSGFVELDTGDPDVRRIASLDGTIDALIGPSGRDNEWRVTGEDEVELNGVAYSGVNVLLGGADNTDTFIFEPDGRVSGYIEGGPGGFDVIELAGGTFGTVEYTTRGPDSGTIARDADVIDYAGMEPIVDATGGATRIFNGTGAADNIRLADRGDPGDGTFVISIDTGEDVIFTDAGAIDHLIINGLGGADTITLGPMGELDAGAVLTVDAGEGDDTIELVLHFLFLDDDVTYSVEGGAGSHDEVSVLTEQDVTLTDTALNTVALSGIERARIVTSANTVGCMKYPLPVPISVRLPPATSDAPRRR